MFLFLFLTTLLFFNCMLSIWPYSVTIYKKQMALFLYICFVSEKLIKDSEGIFSRFIGFCRIIVVSWPTFVSRQRCFCFRICISCISVYFILLYCLIISLYSISALSRFEINRASTMFTQNGLVCQILQLGFQVKQCSLPAFLKCCIVPSWSKKYKKHL